MRMETMDDRLVFTNPPIDINLKQTMKLISKLGCLLNSAGRAVVVWHRKRLDRQHLVDLDERLLEDIGISRHDLNKKFP